MILFLAHQVKNKVLLQQTDARLCCIKTFTMQNIVLASTSPYRRELLARLGLSFAVANPHTDESALPGVAPEALALRVSAD